MVLAVDAVERGVVKMSVAQVQFYRPVGAFVLECQELATAPQHKPFVPAWHTAHIEFVNKCLGLALRKTSHVGDSNFRHKAAYPILQAGAKRGRTWPDRWGTVTCSVVESDPYCAKFVGGLT